MQVLSVRCLLLVLVAAADCIVQCEACEDGDIRLAGGLNQFEGRLEYCTDSMWGDVCGSQWKTANNQVACKQLDSFISSIAQIGSLVSSVTTRPLYGAGNSPAFINNVTCTGDESSLSECPKVTLNQPDGCSDLGGFVYLVCQDPTCEGSDADSVRLVGGVAEGRVEVCDELGRRRQVCETGWDDADASVVCRTLGFQNGTSVTGYQFTEGSIRLPAYTNVNCLGSEESFTDCMPSSNPPINLFIIRPLRCESLAGVICSGEELITSTPVLALTSTITMQSTEGTTLTSSVQQTPSISKMATGTILPTSTRKFVPPSASTAPSPSLLPSPGGRSDNTLLIAVVGGVGGSVVVLLLLVVILFLLILLRRNQSSDKYNVSPENNTGSTAGSMSRNGHLELPAVPMDNLEDSIKKEFQTPTPPRHRTSSEYDHVLLNPLYAQKNRSRSNTIISDHSSVFEDLGYSEVKGPARRSSPSFHINGSPSDTQSQRSHSPRIYHSKTPSNLSNSQPYLDEQGYAALEDATGSHVYDEMDVTHMYDDVTTLSTSMKKTLVPNNELLLSASPYEMPAIGSPASVNNVIKGSLLSPEHKFETARSNPNLSSSSPKRGFLIQSQDRVRKSNPNIASPEYSELENIATRTYDSPRNARGSVEALNKAEYGYEDPIGVRETAVMELIARDYESPVITITGEGKRQYENPDLALEQRNVELETIPE